MSSPRTRAVLMMAVSYLRFALYGPNYLVSNMRIAETKAMLIENAVKILIMDPLEESYLRHSLTRWSIKILTLPIPVKIHIIERNFDLFLLCPVILGR